jgi:hypothetical protein
MKEDILIEIKLEKGENERQVDAMTQKITGLTKANKDLQSANKQLAKSGQENSKEYIENSRQIEINKQKISEATGARKGLVQSLIAEDDSIKALKVRNAELIKQRDQLSTSTAVGKQKIAEINAELDKNNKTIKSNSSELEKQKINIGNYSSALDKVIPGLGALSSSLQKSSEGAGSFGGGIKAMTSGIWGAVKAALAFIATPIGIVLAAVGLALAGIVKYLTGSEEGMDKFAEVSAQVSAVLNVLVDRLILVGKALSDFLSGNFTDGIDGLKTAFSGLGDEMAREAALAKELAQRLDILDDLNLTLKVRLAEQENLIKNLIIQSRNRSLSEEERIAKLTEASDLEKRLTGERIALRMAEINIIASQIQQRNSEKEAAQQAGESTIDFAKRILSNNKILLSDRNKIADQLVEYNNLLDAQANIQDKIQNQEAAIEEQRQARIEKERKAAEKRIADALKEAEDQRKQSEQDRKDIEAAEKEQFANNLKLLQDKATEELNIQKEKYLNEQIAKEEFEAEVTRIEMEALESRRAFLEANGEDTLAIEQQLLDRKIKQKETQAAAEKKINEATLANEKAIQAAKLGLFAQAGQALSQLAGKNKELAIAGVVIQKAAALGQIIANTAIANAKAVAASPLTFGMPWVAINTISGVLSGVSVVAEAAKSISGINSAKGFARGGAVLSGTRINSSHGSPIQRANGDNLLATVKTGEVILNQHQQAALGGDETFRRIGVPGFASGGIVDSETRSAASVAQSTLNINQLAALMNRVQPVLVLEDFEAKQGSVQSIKSIAQVI